MNYTCENCGAPCSIQDMFYHVNAHSALDAITIDTESIRNNFHVKRAHFLCETCAAAYKEWLEDTFAEDLSIQSWVNQS